MMKYFEVEYIKNNNKDKDIVTAQNKLRAIEEFKKKSLGVFINIAEIEEPILIKLKNISENIKEKFKIKKIPLEPYITSLRHISTMLNAGLSIIICLEDIIRTTEHQRLKEIYIIVLKEIEAGLDLSSSFKFFEAELGSISIAMFELGEKTGSLDKSIEKLADILEEIHNNRMKLKKATRYPIMVILAMIIAFSLVITLVIPQFQVLFKDYDTALPFPTILLLWIERMVRSYGIYVVSGAFFISIFISILYRRHEKFKILFDKYMLKVYIVGRVIYLSMIGRFIYVFNRLSVSGVPIIDSLKTAIGIVENTYLRIRLTEIIKAIEEGRSLKDGFKDTDQFESMVIQMISAGENSGALSKMLDKISEIFKQKYTYLVDNIATMIEPLLIAGIAGFVLLLALGIFLPMWSMAQALGGV